MGVVPEDGERTSETVLDRPRKPPDDGATVAMTPAPGSASGASAARAAASAETALITPEQALRHDEASRTRAFAGSLAVLCTLGAATVAMLGGDHLARMLHLGAIIATGLAAWAYFLLARDPAKFDLSWAMAMAAVSTTANATGFYYWGIFSPYAALIPISSYVFSTGSMGGPWFFGLLGVTILTHLGLGIANIAGWVEDVGLFGPATLAGTREQIVLLALLELVIIGSVILARQARASTRKVLEEHNAAVRAIAMRDAQLAEAHAEMREVQSATGRFSGHRVGRFTLHDVLGRGAMGEVYSALTDDGERVAVKLLAPGKLQDEASHRRFEREVRLVAGLSAPNIVRVVEVSPPDAAMPYLAMELLDGIDLAALIKEQPVRPLAEVVEIVRQVAAGLDAAHAAGIVHRDLKPQNVFGAGAVRGSLAQAGTQARTWKVLDFGVSKLADDSGTLTRDHIVGTPGYMAPEQARNEPIDARTDVYALGVLTYRLLTGMPAVMPGEAHSMLYEVVYRMPPRPTTLVELPAAVESVIAVAIAKPPSHRFASAGDLARALAAAADGNPVAEVEARAQAVLARTPWGHWLRRSRKATVTK
jgi:tRNA A-37 threonylcarbamoyl transferase component Bud32